MGDNLGPQFDPQFGDGLYHGTHREIKSGEVLPASKTQHGTINFGLGSPSVAYATESEDTAWALAGIASSNVHRRNDAGGVPGRTRVHTLEPNEKMTVGEFHPDHPDFDWGHENLQEWTAPKFDIKGTIDTMPGKQGTFNLNWNQFRKEPESGPWWEDAANHPDDDHIEHGHYGGEFNQQILRRHGEQRLHMKQDKAQAEAPEQGRLF